MLINDIVDCRTDLLTFSKAIFKSRKGVEWVENWHHRVICEHLERVVIGEIKRLIINIPPRYSKTELAVINFIAWCMGNFSDSEFIHASYSKRLATNNTWNARAITELEVYKDIFGDIELRKDSNAKDEWRTNAGGCVYATGADGTITGYGAGGMSNNFKGCFAYNQKIITKDGDISIGDIVTNKIDTKVLTYDIENKCTNYISIDKYWDNGLNDLFRIYMSDGSYIDCTSDHEFLTDKGWIRAIDLSESFNLVNAKTCDFHNSLSSEASIHCNVDGILSDLMPVIPFSVREIICNTFPCLSKFNLSYAPNTNTVSSGNISRAISTFKNLNNIFSCEFCTRSFLEKWESTMPYSVLHVIALSAIREIRKSIICSDTVEMSNFIIMGSFTYKVFRYQMSDHPKSDFTIDAETNSIVPFTITRGFKKSARSCSSNPSKVRNLVKPFSSLDAYPIFIDYIGVHNTYCLSVGGDNNFIISQNGAIASNCIIIDDPHKAGEANSETMRNNVIDWFSTTIESRTNSKDTPIILIMQRLHEEDLSGFLLNGGNGEKWTHLNIPAIGKDGSPLWEYKHSLEDLKRIENSNSYVYAGQYMQTPAPKGGGIIKEKWFKIVEEEPKFKYRLMFADTAMKTKEVNDYSVLQVWGYTNNNEAYLIDQLRGKWEAPELQKMTEIFWAKHNHRLNGMLRYLYIEDKASGTGLIQTLKKDKLIRVKPIQRNNDKITRTHDSTPYLESGQVYFINGDYIQDLKNELLLFPNGKHDDQVDALNDGISELNNKTNSLKEFVR